MNSNMTIAAVVVTFNRKELLEENLAALLRQTRLPDKIFIIDNNSTDGTETLLRDRGYLQHSLIRYSRLSENIGGAGGFYEGIKVAYEEGYNWIWVMDDDAEPYKNALEELLLMPDLSNTSRIGMLSSTVVYPDGQISYHHRRTIDLRTLIIYNQKDKCYKEPFFEVDLVSFVGTLINREFVEELGLPLKKYFIHYDDTEYSLRARTHGWKILNSSRSQIIHKTKERETKLIHMEFAKGFYYKRRNIIYTYKKYGRNSWALMIIICIWMVRNLTTIVLFRNNKLHSTKLLWFATIDGLKGNFKRDI
jgi:rhamnopyranosyl-N-acetylglucosaminyl-diphospho-decaprenol beta-1,3/1,4-galactofuranosyltransferase